jgi:hypothetical protein
LLPWRMATFFLRCTKSNVVRTGNSNKSFRGTWFAPIAADQRLVVTRRS